MIIKEVLAQLENAETPVIRVLKANTNSKVLVLGFKKGMILKEHKTAVPAKLVVLAGAVTYKQQDKSIPLNQYSDLDIPVDIPHSVEAAGADSLCFLIVG